MYETINTQSIAIYLRQNIEAKLSPEYNTLIQYADAMGVSAKKLQRLLSQEGTSFSNILNAYRAEKTMELLGETSLPMRAIAFKLGYSSGEAFNTACKRWYNQSPRKLRQNLNRLNNARTHNN